MLYSLIIPHYSDSVRLARLLQSLPNRPDIQILVVDDCSPDQQGLAELKHEYSQVTYLSTAINSGAGAARNIGLEHAVGKFILFADADDVLLSDAFNIFDGAIREDADIYYFLADATVEKTGERSVRADAINSLVYDYLSNPTRKTETDLRLKHCVPVAKLYKRSFIKESNVAFDEVLVSNDVYFNTINGVLAERIKVIEQVVYRIYRLSDSLTSTTTADRLLTRVKVSAKTANKLKELGFEHQRSVTGFLLSSVAFGPKVFIKVFWIGLTSDLRFDFLRVFNLKRWVGFFRRKIKLQIEKGG